MATTNTTAVNFVKVGTLAAYNQLTKVDGTVYFVVSEKKIYLDGIGYGFNDGDVANKFLPLLGGTMLGAINMGGKEIHNLSQLRGSGAAIEFDGSNRIAFNGPVTNKILEIEEVADETQAKVIRFGADIITGVPDPDDETSPINVGYLESEVLNKKGVANGFAELDGTGKVPSTQLPSYVDDVLEYSKRTDFPAAGEAGKLYVAIDTGAIWRWSGSAYVEISAGSGALVLGTTSSTAFRGDYGNQAYLHISKKDNPHAVTKTQVGLGSVENYGVATKAEAEAGTSAAKYMTPQRTKEAITQLAPKLTWTVH